MIHKYLYMGQDLTLDVVIKVEMIVDRVCKKEGSEFEEVLIKFFKSNTYKNLKSKESILKTRETEFIVNELFREWTKNNTIQPNAQGDYGYELFKTVTLG